MPNNQNTHPALPLLFATAKQWAAQDPDRQTRRELQQLIQQAETGNAAAIEQLQSCFAGRLTFGTAGLRGEMGPGSARMNRVVVAQTSAGFAAYLLARAARGECANPPEVVIGYDGRDNSEVFAQDAAEIMAGAGVRVFLLPEAGPTPLTSFAVRNLDVSAGVMITASHNPPRDNGYKVYLGDADCGSQIIPPADKEIAAQIEKAAERPVSQLPRATDYTVLGGGVADAYVAATAGAVLAGLAASAAAPANNSPKQGKKKAKQQNSAPLKVVYTAMHGVGAKLTARVLRSALLPTLIPVPAQIDPDGAFPTVDFPNPEEPGALDLAIQTACENGAKLIIAHDPDADRLALAAPRPDTSGKNPADWQRLTGNELGLLLGWRAAERAAAHAYELATEAKGALACTVVSSPVLAPVAAAYGLDYAETLSGFKWVSRVPGLIFGFEEALGYLCYPQLTRDKDGISAAADALALARELHAAGQTVWDRLNEAAERFGYYASTQVTLRLPSMREAQDAAAALRKAAPREVAGKKVTAFRDMLREPLDGVRADVLRFDFGQAARVMVRPSGTEPKLKVYVDANSKTGSVAERRKAAEQTVEQLAAGMRKLLGA